MPQWFYEIPVFLALGLIYILCCSISLIGYWFSNIFFQKVDKYEIVTKVVWQTVLFFSTMLITFWIATNWHNLKDLTQVTKKEARDIKELYAYSKLPDAPEVTKELRTILMAYLDSVINKEYASLHKGEVNIETLNLYLKFIKTARYYMPNNSLTNEFAYNRLMSGVLDLIQSRADRLGYLPGELNGTLLGFFLIIMIIGCFWTGAIYSKNFIFSLIIIMSQNIIMASSIWLIFEIDKPFQGEIIIDNQPFIDAKKDILEIRKELNE